MQEILFNPAIWMPVAVFVIAIGLFIYGNNRVKAGIRNGGIALAAVVVVWMGVAYFVQTPVEQCVTRTHAILSAVESADWPKLRTLLDDATSLERLRGRERIATATESAATSFSLKNVRVLSTETIRGVGTVDVNFSALLEGLSPVTSNWRFEFETRPSGIVLTRIVPITIGTAGTDQIRRNVIGQ